MLFVPGGEAERRVLPKSPRYMGWPGAMWQWIDRHRRLLFLSIPPPPHPPAVHLPPQRRLYLPLGLGAYCRPARIPPTTLCAWSSPPRHAHRPSPSPPPPPPFHPLCKHLWPFRSQGGHAAYIKRRDTLRLPAAGAGLATGGCGPRNHPRLNKLAWECMSCTNNASQVSLLAAGGCRIHMPEYLRLARLMSRYSSLKLSRVNLGLPR